MQINPVKIISKNQKWLLVAIFLAGFLIRLVDLTDAPIDFHPTRQFRGATIARSIYIDSLPVDHPDYGIIGGDMARQFEDLEPPILENIMATVYRVFGGEKVWMVRIVNSILWGTGGLALFAFVSQSVGFAPAIISTLYFLFLPFGVIASRSFQPDPLMTVGIILSIFLAHKYHQKSNWKNTILLAFVAGITILIKVAAVYLIGGVMVSLVLYRGLGTSLKDPKIWFMAIIMMAIPASYYVFSGENAIAGNAGSWMLQMLPLLKKPDFWIGWTKRLFAFGPVSSLTAGLGVFTILRTFKIKKNSDLDLSGKLLLGGLTGYFLYGLSFPYHIPTHSYYHIQLTPLVAWAISFGILTILSQIKPNPKFLPNILSGLVVMWVIFIGSKSINTLLENDYRHEPPYWQRIGSVIPPNGKTVGLVSYYGFLLRYYGGQVVTAWPESAEQALAAIRGEDQSDFVSYFEEKTAGNAYFLVTAFNQLEAQPNLSNYLYENFQIVDEGNGFILFSLDN